MAGVVVVVAAAAAATAATAAAVVVALVFLFKHAVQIETISGFVSAGKGGYITVGILIRLAGTIR